MTEKTKPMTIAEALRIVRAVEAYACIQKISSELDYVNDVTGMSMTPREFGQKKRHARKKIAEHEEYLAAQQSLELDTADSAEDLKDGYNYEED
jgi:hypothetical protein